jgi:tetratricopeptide (TPR) repeat protein
MTRKEILLKSSSIERLTATGELAAALELLKEMIRNCSRSDFIYDLETLTANYLNLLRYSFEGYHDPRQKNILNSISAGIFHLSDQVVYHLTEDFYPQRKIDRQTIRSHFRDDPSVVFPGISDDLFRLIWLTNETEDFYTRLVRQFEQESAAEWHDRCLFVSALTLSLLQYFDPHKFKLLSGFIYRQEPQVYHRALTGFVAGLLKYDQRIRFYPEITDILKDLAGFESIRQDVEVILLQYLMARETEKITREFEKEVLPEMQKMMPRIEDKLQLDDLVEEDDPEGKNPGWKDMIEEVPGLFEKIEKFSRMQMEGGDVFMSAFSMLKRFEFFNVISHWFAPFYKEHPAIRQAEIGEEDIRERLMDGLVKAFYICNSDKYSFALNFQAIPARQRSMIVTHFEAELEQMKDMASEEELLDPVMISNAIYTQYIQDLYRFYKLHPNRNEFDDMFQWSVNFNRLSFYLSWFQHDTFTEKLAGFYFDKAHWDEAVTLYEFLTEKGTPRSDWYQKIGYAREQQGNYSLAIENYRKAELFDIDRLWLLKKLVRCSMKMEQYETALSSLLEALELQPEDMQLHSLAGQCYLKLNEFERAVHHYSKVRFYSPGNLKSLRPIAYSLFVMGKLDQAREAYEEILSSSDTPSPYDLMNAGHVALCTGNRGKALELYHKSLNAEGFGKKQFIHAFREDIPWLEKCGITPEEIPLIADYILISID